MWNEEAERVVQELAEEVMQGVKEWRLKNPKATFREIEAAVDGRWARARARLLQEVALASDATKVSSGPEGGGTECPQCGQCLESRGQGTRSLSTHYDQRISLKRSYGVCSACGTGLFPPG